MFQSIYKGFPIRRLCNTVYFFALLAFQIFKLMTGKITWYMETLKFQNIPSTFIEIGQFIEDKLLHSWIFSGFEYYQQCAYNEKSCLGTVLLQKRTL